MSEATQILAAMAEGASRAEDLLPLVCHELCQDLAPPGTSKWGTNFEGNLEA